MVFFRAGTVSRVDLFSGSILPQPWNFFLKDFSPDRECSGEMKNKTTRVRGRWDRWDSILDRSASDLFSAERKNSPIRFGENGALDPRAASVTEEAVLAIVTAMNAFSIDVSACPVSPAEAARMKTTAPVEAAAIESVDPNSGADQLGYWLFNR